MFDDSERKWQPIFTYDELNWIQHILSADLYNDRLSNPSAIKLHRQCLYAIEAELEKADEERTKTFKKKN